MLHWGCLFAANEEVDVSDHLNGLAAPGPVRYYLRHVRLRAEMAARAHALCVPVYSYVARARLIAGFLERRLGN
jgi:hypothetical protein